MKKSAEREDAHATRAMRERPEWVHNEWWYAQSMQLPEVSCIYNHDHGIARVFRSLGYHCSICGWEKVLIVQEGQLEPCAPATELPPPIREHMRRVLLGRKGAKVRAEKFAARKRSRRSENDV